MEILIKRLNEQARLPEYSSEVEPGISLYALEEVTIEPNTQVIVTTGVAMAVPVGYIGIIRNLNNMTTNETLQVKDGMIDSGYRDEIVVEIKNIGTEAKTFSAGVAVAQLVIQQAHHALLIEADDLSAPAEGEAG